MIMIVDTLPVFYYEKMVDYTPSSFDDMVFTDERIKVGLKRGKSDHLVLINEKKKKKLGQVVPLSLSKSSTFNLGGVMILGSRNNSLG